MATVQLEDWKGLGWTQGYQLESYGNNPGEDETTGPVVE